MKKILIIGGGIAGTTLAFRMEERGVDFLLVDDEPKVNATRVATGFWNPVVFRRLTKSFNADILLEELNPFYDNLEEKLEAKFKYDITLLRVIASEDERRMFINKALASEVSHFLDTNLMEKVNGIDSPFGLGRVFQTGYMNTEVYLDEAIKYLKKENKFKTARVSYDDIIKVDGGYEYDGDVFTDIVFSEGWKGEENPWFPELDFAPAKGEELILEIPDLTDEYTFNRNLILMPIGDNLFKCGSTYEWDDLNREPTKEKREEIEKKLKVFLKCDFKVVNHVAGVRPATHDRRPYMGTSEKDGNVHIFNGMGTKGIFYSPYYSDRMADLILDGKKLDYEVDIIRLKDWNG